MNKIIELIQEKWHRKPPANEMEIGNVEQQLGVRFPPDYRELLDWSNGGEAKLGSAYFSLWSVQEVPRRNVSASIFKYMTDRFVGIGTNGGDECYALDYTKGDIPTIAIVPLGDLDPESKYTIASSLTQSIQLAVDGQFDDGEYNSVCVEKLSDELTRIQMTNIRMDADNAWQKKEYARYVALLEKVQNNLTPVELKKFHFARSRI